MSESGNNLLVSDQITKASYFFLPSEAGEDRRLCIHYGGRELCDPDYKVEREHLPFHTLEFVIHGKGRISRGHASCPLSPGIAFAHKPYEYHRITTDPDEPMVKYFVCFSGDDAEELVQISGLTSEAPVMMTQSRWIASNFDQLIECGSAHPPNKTEICDTLLRLILHRVRFDMLPATDVSSPAYQTYLKCRAFIEQEHLTLRSAAEVAAGMHVDPAYLSRLFKRFAYESPYQFLLRLKMDLAAKILINEHKSVKETAAALGFQDQGHFSRVFKSKHGLSPKQFIKQNSRYTP